MCEIVTSHCSAWDRSRLLSPGRKSQPSAHNRVAFPRADYGQRDPQIPALLPHGRVLRYDIPGHGGSDAPADDYTIE